MSDTGINLSKNSACPCGTKQKFVKCCGIYLKKKSLAPTAEKLMRSRYVAYQLKDESYLLNTWHSTTRPETLDLQDENVKWTGLEIIKTKAGMPNDTEGRVEFRARFQKNEQQSNLHENSRFLKENNQWFYLDGEISKE